MLLSFANANLYAQSNCNKCCGLWHMGETSHRICDDFYLCHVTECDMGKGNTGDCCWAIGDHYNDICSDYEAQDWYHGCYDE